MVYSYIILYIFRAILGLTHNFFYKKSQ